MEAKYTKGSKTLESLHEIMVNEEKAKRAQQKAEEEARMEKEGYFHTGKELLDYILSGGKIVDRYDSHDWMQLIDGVVVHQTLYYNDIDMPLGYYRKIKTIEEFKDWVATLEKYQKEDGKKFVNEYFHPVVEEEIEY